MMMMMIAPNSRLERGDSREEGRKGRAEGRSYRYFFVRDVGCEGQDKIWTEVWGSPPQEEQRGLVLSTHDRNGLHIH